MDENLTVAITESTEALLDEAKEDELPLAVVHMQNHMDISDVDSVKELFENEAHHRLFQIDGKIYEVKHRNQEGQVDKELPLEDPDNAQDKRDMDDDMMHHENSVDNGKYQHGVDDDADHNTDKWPINNKNGSKGKGDEDQSGNKGEVDAGDNSNDPDGQKEEPVEGDVDKGNNPDEGDSHGNKGQDDAGSNGNSGQPSDSGNQGGSSSGGNNK